MTTIRSPLAHCADPNPPFLVVLAVHNSKPVRALVRKVSSYVCRLSCRVVGYCPRRARLLRCLLILSIILNSDRRAPIKDPHVHRESFSLSLHFPSNLYVPEDSIQISQLPSRFHLEPAGWECVSERQRLADNNEIQTSNELNNDRQKQTDGREREKKER